MSGEEPADSRPILVAVDFSRCSVAALSWGAQLAGERRCPLIVLHVVHDPEDAPGSYRVGVAGADASSASEPMESAAARLLEEFLSDCRADTPHLRRLGDVETILVVGLPATRIVEVAEKQDAQLIVVGSRGRTGLRHLLLGSKALRVAQISPIPVTIVKAAAPSGESVEDATP